MTPFPVRSLAAAGLAGAAFLWLVGTPTFSPVATPAGMGPTPRTAVVCAPDACPVAPERIRPGFGSSDSRLPAPAVAPDRDVRWAPPVDGAR